MFALAAVITVIICAIPLTALVAFFLYVEGVALTLAVILSATVFAIASGFIIRGILKQ